MHPFYYGLSIRSILTVLSVEVLAAENSNEELSVCAPKSKLVVLNPDLYA